MAGANRFFYRVAIAFVKRSKVTNLVLQINFELKYVGGWRSLDI